MNDTCRWCEGELERAEGPGRPARYCSSACKRLAEFAVRRAERNVARADIEVEKWARYMRGEGFTGSVGHAQSRFAGAIAQRDLADQEHEALIRRLER
jgi:hypothetical protein